jgi:hypothetical protein
MTKAKKRISLRAVVYNKPVGYCTPVKNHNIGRQQARATRKNFVVK